MSRDAFSCLRALVLTNVPGFPFALDPDIVPIEQTLDDWYVLTRTGDVVHIDAAGLSTEARSAPALGLALVGKLSRRFPLATLFLPSVSGVDVCPVCNGTGLVAALPVGLRETVTCRCGGIGWVPSERA